MQLSANTRHLLAQHLHWVNNGYDSVKLNDVLMSLRNENPFRSIKLNHFEDKIGRPQTDDFELKDFGKLTYFYPCLINFDGNLSFLKYCTNLEEVDFAGLNLVEISDLKHLKNLIKLDLSYTNIKSIDALTSIANIESLNLGNCNTVSLTPLFHHNKLKKIVLENVEEEEDILNIISNQKVISAEYLVGNSSVIFGLTFSRYLVCINLEKEKLSISMTSLVTDKFGSFFKIPKEFIDDSRFIVEYIKLLNTELDKRVKAILKTNYDIVESSKYYTNEEIDFGVELNIKRCNND